MPNAAQALSQPPSADAVPPDDTTAGFEELTLEGVNARLWRQPEHAEGLLCIAVLPPGCATFRPAWP